MIIGFTLLCVGAIVIFAVALTIALKRDYMRFRQDAKELGQLVAEARLDLEARTGQLYYTGQRRPNEGQNFRPVSSFGDVLIENELHNLDGLLPEEDDTVPMYRRA